MSDSISADKGANAGLAALVLRIFWMFLGNTALGVCLLMIVQQGSAFTYADPIYGIVLLLLVAARYVDIVRYNGVTAYGDPATPAHWRRYTIALLLLAGGGWLAAHGAAYILP
ncbi:MAG TPA: hypothetical protein PKO36_07750 [Candidatus Hydrogenedentes bacterium]|nr:hypothetical protein [Candidatus Hydrogenedentota bacterium]HOV74760.1 hypothetical protein [Candidatus Hydrogenedentota bacterium]